MDVVERILRILKEREMKQKLFIVLLCGILIIAAFGSGILYASGNTQTHGSLYSLGEINPEVPYLTIQGMHDNSLVMSTRSHPIRIEYEGTAYNAPSDSTFQLYLSSTGTTIPEEGDALNTPCLFVASESGKYVYEAGSSQASRIKNKVCFQDQASAMEKGYELYNK